MNIPIPDDYELQPLDTIPIKKPEAREQARLVAALRCKWSVIDDLALRPVIFHVPNGGSRNAMEATNLKTQGVLAGVPDLVLVLPRNRVIWVEMKAADGRRSKSQVDLHDHFAKLGQCVITAFSAEEALGALRELRL